jgi:hypothetical protein
MSIEPTKEEIEILVEKDDLESLSAHPGWARFTNKLLNLIKKNYELFLEAPKEDLDAIRVEARSLWHILGACNDGIRTGLQTATLIQERHEEASRRVEDDIRNSEAALRLRRVYEANVSRRGQQLVL